MHTLDQKIETLIKHGFKKRDLPLIYHTEDKAFSTQYLIDASIERLRKGLASLCVVTEPAEEASQELIEIFGDEKACWLETAELKKFDRPMMLYKGLYLLSEDYISETPLETLIKDIQNMSDLMSTMYADNIPLYNKQADQDSLNERELTDRLTNLLESMIQEMPALKILPKSVMKALVKKHIKNTNIGDYESFDQVLSIFERKLKA